MKNASRFFFLIIAIVLAFLTSCIELTQTIEVNKNKSGRYTFTINLGMLQFADPSAMPDAFDFLNTLKEVPAKAIEKLSGAEGLSEIENITSESEGIYGFRFSFDNDKSLNKGLYELANQQKLFFMPDFVKIKRKKVVLTDIAPYVKKAWESQKSDAATSFLNDQIQQYIQLTTIVQVPSEVKSTGNIRAKTEYSKVSNSLTLSDLIKGVNYGLTIKY